MICLHQPFVGLGQPVGFENGYRPPAQELGATDIAAPSQFVESRHQIVVQLHQYFASRHHHMIEHMVAVGRV